MTYCPSKSWRQDYAPEITVLSDRTVVRRKPFECRCCRKTKLAGTKARVTVYADDDRKLRTDVICAQASDGYCYGEVRPFRAHFERRADCRDTTLKPSFEVEFNDHPSGAAMHARDWEIGNPDYTFVRLEELPAAAV